MESGIGILNGNGFSLIFLAFPMDALLLLLMFFGPAAVVALLEFKWTFLIALTMAVAVMFNCFGTILFNHLVFFLLGTIFITCIFHCFGIFVTDLLTNHGFIQSEHDISKFLFKRDESTPIVPEGFVEADDPGKIGPPPETDEPAEKPKLKKRKWWIRDVLEYKNRWRMR